MDSFGVVGSFNAQPGEGDRLAAILIRAAEALEANEDCRLYVVSRSPDAPEAVWVTEAWASREAHEASLADPGVRALIGEARPLIAGVGERFELIPVGGKGLPANARQDERRGA